MAPIWRIRRSVFALITGAAIAIGLLFGPIVTGTSTPAAAQISEDAQIALEQYGMWRPHPRFGDVWVPAGIPPDWRPYQYGHWVYTDEWGWYWVSDDVEANWGWVVYHYGRWAFERGFGWFWVPGDEWAPAWVNWRYGDQYVGWAPLPPDELLGVYEAEPAYWTFVPGRYLAAPVLRAYYVPVYRRSVILRTTNIVNRTVPVHGARLAVNPGIPPAYVARVSGAPVATYRVRPRVFASTQGVSGAVQINRDELRRPSPGGPPGRPGGPERPGITPPPRLPPVSIERTTTVIPPSASVTAPQPLGRNEPGRLGATPPRAAQGTAPPSSTTPLSAPPASTPPGQREEHRDRDAPRGPPPQQPNVVRPTPPQATPPSPPPGATPPQQRQVQPPEPPTGQQPLQREEHRERTGPGGPPPQQPNIVRPTPPQVSPPPGAPPPQQRQVQPPPQPPPGPPPQQQQRQVQPPPGPPPQQQRVQPPPGPPPQQQRVQPPPGPPPQGARGPGQPPPGPPPKRPPPQPGEKPDEKK
jgi:uncharacterized protein DUF6600